MKRIWRNLRYFTVYVLPICFFAVNPQDALADSGKKTENTWTYFVTPELSQSEKYRLAVQAHSNRENYISESNRKIRDFSQRLEDYIRLWIEGKAEGRFPHGFFSEWIDNEKTHDWQIIKPDQITAAEQWYIMSSYNPNKELHQFSPDPHATYLKLIFLAPLGSKLIIEGDFPHARFMDYQILIPVNPLFPVTGRDGVCEVPIVDVDIEPDPGHINPFRLESQRNAKKRHYHVTFELSHGNALELNPEAMIPPGCRAKGNSRTGGPFAFTGPWGGNVIVPSVVWLRYYAPDKSAGPLGGVPLPKAYLKLPSGEEYWITCDKTKAVSLQTDPVPRISESVPEEPYPFIGPHLGWFKMYDIMMSHAEAQAYYTSRPWGRDNPLERKKRIRQTFRLLFNRGFDAPPPGNYETGPTCCNYTSYLVRPMCLGKNKVIVLTGKMPSCPKTRNSEKTMTTAEARYFSITHQLGINNEENKSYGGTPYGSLMDDEITVNEQNEYIIVFSRRKDRPENAHAECDVTWQEWGEPARQGLILRWMSVYPDHYLAKYVPDESNAPWKTGAWSQDTYDKTLVGENRPGVLGPYHPVLHYLSKEEFEALGDRIDPSRIPKWGYKDSKKQRRPHEKKNVSFISLNLNIFHCLLFKGPKIY